MTIAPHTVTLTDGRTIGFYNYDYFPEYAGSFTTPPESAEVMIDDAFWLDLNSGNLSVRSLSIEEMDKLHDGPDYEIVLAFVTELKDAEREADIANGCDEYSSTETK